MAHGESNYAMFTGVMKQYMEIKSDGEIDRLNRYIAAILGCGTAEVYDKLEELCQISVTTMKKTISGTQKISRNFLYKFVVGLHMSVEEANEYFALCGGELNLKNPADFICYRALEDGDSIFQFIEDFEHYTGLKIALR